MALGRFVVAANNAEFMGTNDAATASYWLFRTDKLRKVAHSSRFKETIYVNEEFSGAVFVAQTSYDCE